MTYGAVTVTVTIKAALLSFKGFTGPRLHQTPFSDTLASLRRALYASRCSSEILESWCYL